MENTSLQEKNIYSEALRILEGMKVLGPQAKVDLLAVHLDIKPASLVETDLIHPSKLEIARKHIEKLFTDFGFVYREDGIDYQNDPFVLLTYGVAKHNESLERMKHALDLSGGGDEYNNALGQALGIPDSAVSGFVSGKRLSQDEIKERFSKEERAFMFFIPSQEGWKSERELLRHLAERIKVVSPPIYTEALNRIKD